MRATQVESPQDVARWISTPWKWCGRYALDLIIEAGERLARTDTHRATESLPEVSDDMRELVEDEWPELVQKLPPKVPTSR
jgi:hypothetical protein